MSFNKHNNYIERKATFMGTYLNPSNQNFKEMLNGKIYVDKTKFLSIIRTYIDTPQKCINVSRPRRFGKTSIIDMMIAYFSRSCDSKELFKELKIGKDPDFEKHLNQYEVIHIDMSKFKKHGHNFVKQFQIEIMKEFIREYPELHLEENMYLEDGMMEIYRNYHIEFVVLIDEWDMVFREFPDNTSLQREYIDLLRTLFKNGNFSYCIKLAYLTGIFPIKHYGTGSGLNNFEEYPVYDSVFAQYFGFTEEEVKELCAKFSMNFDKIKEWYDGYTIGNYSIYNPKSVVSYIEHKNIQSYWTKTDSYESLKNYIVYDFDGLKGAIVNLMSEQRINVNTRHFETDLKTLKKKDNVLTALIHLGYLTYENGKCWIPNKEVYMEFKDTIEDSEDEKLLEMYQLIQESKAFLNDILDQNEKEVAKHIEWIHDQYISSLEYHDENSLACVLTLPLYLCKDIYSFIREFPTGKGFADIVLLSKNKKYPNIIMELKWDKRADSAISQIHEKQYFRNEIFDQDCILVGINYDRKTKVHTCIIENYVK